MTENHAVTIYGENIPQELQNSSMQPLFVQHPNVALALHSGTPTFDKTEEEQIRLFKIPDDILAHHVFFFLTQKEICNVMSAHPRFLSCAVTALCLKLSLPRCQLYSEVEGVLDLNLSNSQVDTHDAIVLAHILKSNSSILKLNLNGNEIGPEGAVALAKSLKANATLKELNLANNMIGSCGAIAIAEALAFNVTLSVLNVAERSYFFSGSFSPVPDRKLCSLNLINPIGEKGFAALAEVLKGNDKMKICVDGEGIEMLACALGVSIDHSCISWNLAPDANAEFQHLEGHRMTRMNRPGIFYIDMHHLNEEKKEKEKKREEQSKWREAFFAKMRHKQVERNKRKQKKRSRRRRK